MPNVPLCQEGDVSCLYAMHLVGADDFAQLFATKERYRCGMPLAGTVRPSLQFSAAPCRGRCPHRPASAILRRADILECRGGRLCAAVRDEGALQMRHAPCGYCPPAFAIFYRTLQGPMGHRPLQIESSIFTGGAMPRPFPFVIPPQESPAPLPHGRRAR